MTAPLTSKTDDDGLGIATDDEENGDSKEVSFRGGAAPTTTTTTIAVEPTTDDGHAHDEQAAVAAPGRVVRGQIFIQTGSRPAGNGKR